MKSLLLVVTMIVQDTEKLCWTLYSGDQVSVGLKGLRVPLGVLSRDLDVIRATASVS
jgi:hypothetical protein